MKKKFLLICLLSYSIIFSLQITDIRYGSYYDGKIKENRSDKTDHTRIIIEFDNQTEYKHFYSNNAINISLPKFTTLLSSNYLIDDGLTNNIMLDSTAVKIGIIGKYKVHKVTTLDSPFRIAVDIIGDSIEQPKKQIITQQQPQISILSRKQPRKIELENIMEFLPSQERVYFDLYELPIDQILRYFSKQSKFSILKDETVSGDVSLSIKNQTLSSAFKLLLESQGLSYYLENETVIVTKADISDFSAEETLYSVYLNYIKSDEMKDILDFYLNNNNVILTNSNSNLLQISIPEIFIPQVDSLINAYDKPAPKVLCKITAGIAQKSKLNGFSRNMKMINTISERDLNNLKRETLYSQSVPINQNIYYSYYKEKDFANGFFKNPGRIKTGFALRFNLRFSRKKLFDIAIKADLSIVNQKHTQFSTSFFERMDLELDESVLIVPTVNSISDFDDFLDEDIIFYNSEDYFQFLIITPAISGQ